MSEATFSQWGLLELMGHRRLAGFISEAQIGGAGFIRIDVPGDDPGIGQPSATQFYSPSAVYAITPLSEEMARRFAKGNQPAPITRWELPVAKEPPPFDEGERDEEIDEDDDDPYD